MKLFFLTGYGSSSLVENRNRFLESTVETLLSVTNIPRMRLQRFELQMDSRNVYVLGTLLDSPPALSKIYMINPVTPEFLTGNLPVLNLYTSIIANRGFSQKSLT